MLRTETFYLSINLDTFQIRSLNVGWIYGIVSIHVEYTYILAKCLHHSEGTSLLSSESWAREARDRCCMSCVTLSVHL